MVRLKVDFFVKCYFIILFQFQYGAIKSTEFYGAGDDVLLFQFQYGAIKSVERHRTRYYQEIFQFQYGAIKRIISLSSTVPPICISIPIWCD